MSKTATILHDLQCSLDAAGERLEACDYYSAFQLLGDKLSELHDEALALGFGERARDVVRAHEVFTYCQQDPYTARAFEKPRGYAGDAVMLDFVYAGTAPEGTSNVGRGVFSQTTGGPMGLSVEFRRRLLRSFINDVIARNLSARILSVASGHCREVEDSLALHEAFSGAFIAFDQDEASCAEVERCYGPSVTTQVGSVKRLLMGAYNLGEFDLIYSAGLYDYLPATLAAKLSATLGGMLRPGGRLVTANFATGSHGRGYLDWVMDWQLLYRSPEEFAMISNPGRKTERVSVFSDPHENVIYSTYRC